MKIELFTKFITIFCVGFLIGSSVMFLSLRQEYVAVRDFGLCLERHINGGELWMIDVKSCYESFIEAKVANIKN